MKKHYVMLNSFQHLLTTILGGAFLCIVFASCNNFLKADEVKKEITKAIEYNNAASYTIRVEATRGSGTILIPAGLEVNKKVTDTFTVKFEPDEAYKFVQWTATVPDLAEGDSASNYIKFEDATSLETTVTFTKAHPGIVITPDCPAIPTATITLEGSNGTFSPTTGEHTIRQWVPLSISYDPNSDYAFLCWKIYDLNTMQEIPNGTYLTITDPKSRKTECELTTPLPEGSDIKLCIEAINDKRPRVVSATPQWNDEGVRKDSRIQVMFDKPMSEKSIYYDEESGEITKLKADYDLQDNDFLWDGSNCYGYIKGGKTYFKNISIVDYASNDESIAGKFKAPYFETSKTLVIPVNDASATSMPDTGTLIIVTIDDKFFLERTSQEQSELPVTLKESHIWQYLVNGETDNVPPVFSDDTTITNTRDTVEPLGDIADDSVKLIDRSLKMKLKASDTGSGPTSNFVLYIQKDEEGAKVEKVSVPAVVFSSNASFDDGEVNNQRIAKVFQLPEDLELTHGKYRLLVACSDKSGKIGTYPPNHSKTDNSKPVTIADLTDLHDLDTKWFEIDKQSPKVKSFTSFSDSNPLNIKMTLLKEDSEDLDHIKISYKIYNSSDALQEITVQKSELTLDTEDSDEEKDVYKYKVDNAEFGRIYTITLTAYDDVNNASNTTSNHRTNPAKLTNVTYEIIRDHSNSDAQDQIKFSWTKPEGNYTGAIIQYKCRHYDYNNWSSFTTKADFHDYNNECTYTIDGLLYSSEYIFRIYTSDGYYWSSEAFEIGTETNPIITKPQKLDTNKIKIGQTSNSITIKGDHYGNEVSLRPHKTVTNNSTQETTTYYSVTGFLYRYRADNSSWLPTYQTETGDSITIRNLTAGIKYYIEIIPYYINDSNKGVPVYLQEQLAVDAPSSISVNYSDVLTYDGTTQLSTTVTWSQVNGNFTDYYLKVSKQYSNSSNSSWTVMDTKLISKNSSRTYTSTSLKFNTTYKFEVCACTANGNNPIVYFDAASTEKKSPFEPCIIKSVETESANVKVTWRLPAGYETRDVLSSATFYLGYGSTYDEAKTNARYGSSKGCELTVSDFLDKDRTQLISMQSLGMNAGETCHFVIKMILNSIYVYSRDKFCEIPDIIYPVIFNDVKEWDKTQNSVRFTWQNPDKWDSLEIYNRNPQTSPAPSPLATINKNSSGSTPKNEYTITGLSRYDYAYCYVVTVYNGEKSEPAFKSQQTETTYSYNYSTTPRIEYNSASNDTLLKIVWSKPTDTTYKYRIKCVNLTNPSSYGWTYYRYYDTAPKRLRPTGSSSAYITASELGNSSISTYSIPIASETPLSFVYGNEYVMKIERYDSNYEGATAVNVNTIRFKYNGSSVSIIEY